MTENTRISEEFGGVDLSVTRMKDGSYEAVVWTNAFGECLWAYGGHAETAEEAERLALTGLFNGISKLRRDLIAYMWEEGQGEDSGSGSDLRTEV